MIEVTRGDLIYVLCRVNRKAKDGSWMEVQVPTLDPGTGRDYTVGGKRKNVDGWWSRAVRLNPDAAWFPERDQ